MDKRKISDREARGRRLAINALTGADGRDNQDASRAAALVRLLDQIEADPAALAAVDPSLLDQCSALAREGMAAVDAVATTPRRTWSPLRADEIRRIGELRKAGLRPEEIAASIGRSVSSVRGVTDRQIWREEMDQR